MKHKCPTCKKPVRATKTKKGQMSRFYPFCSRRCKLIDLGAWLNADYKVISLSSDTADSENNENR